MTADHNLPQNSRRIPWVLVLIFSLLSLGILVLGYVYYQNHVSLFLRDKEGELKTIADMKVNQIMEWRLERMHDARLVLEDPLFAIHVQDWFEGKGEGDLRELLLHRLAGSPGRSPLKLSISVILCTCISLNSPSTAYY